jgi:serine/threonine-protein kinase
MERCVASAADRVAAQGPVAPDDAVRMITAVLAALTAAHAAGVVHRDIKPANILLRADGSAALSDWGIARALFGSGVTHTTSIALLGTLPYLAPELRQDPRAASPATDLYAVGITLAWLLTGKVPPDPFVPAGEAVIRAALPAGLADVVLRACAWEPAQRYASAAEMAGGLEGAGLGEVRAVARKAAGVARRSAGPMWLGWAGVAGGRGRRRRSRRGRPVKGRRYRTVRMRSWTG